MITLFRLIRLWQLKIKWKLAFYQFIEQQFRNPQELEKTIISEMANIIHENNSSNATGKEMFKTVNKKANS